MKLYSLVILLVLTFAVQKSRTEEMNSIKLEKRPFQIYPVDIAANAKVLQVYVFFFMKYDLFDSHLISRRTPIYKFWENW